jgi:hypothetical protein
MCCTSSYSTMKSKAAIKHGEPPRKPTSLPIWITLAWTCSESMAGLLSAFFGRFDCVRQELLVRIARTFVRCLTGTVHNLSDYMGSKTFPDLDLRNVRHLIASPAIAALTESVKAGPATRLGRLPCLTSQRRLLPRYPPYVATGCKRPANLLRPK